MGWTDRLLTGWAEDMASAGIGTWRTNAPYMPEEVAITHRVILPAPDRLITLAAYPAGQEEPGQADHLLAVQVRVRGTTDPTTCDDLADAIFERYSGAEQLTLGGVRVVQMWRQSYTSTGQDSGDRWTRSENYYLSAMRRTVHNDQ